MLWHSSIAGWLARQLRLLGNVLITLIRRMLRERLHHMRRLILRGLAQISSAQPGCSLPDGGGGGNVLGRGSNTYMARSELKIVCCRQMLAKVFLLGKTESKIAGDQALPALELFDAFPS